VEDKNIYGSVLSKTYDNDLLDALAASLERLFHPTQTHMPC
jgi:hypothetical protein